MHFFGNGIYLVFLLYDSNILQETAVRYEYNCMFLYNLIRRSTLAIWVDLTIKDKHYTKGFWQIRCSRRERLDQEIQSNNRRDAFNARQRCLMTADWCLLVSKLKGTISQSYYYLLSLLKSFFSSANELDQLSSAGFLFLFTLNANLTEYSCVQICITYVDFNIQPICIHGIVTY